MPTITSFEDFFAHADIDGASEAAALKNAVDEETEELHFRVTRKGVNLFVQDLTNDLTLMLTSDKSRDYFLECIENKFGGELGVEDQAEFERLMDKANS